MPPFQKALEFADIREGDNLLTFAYSNGDGTSVLEYLRFIFTRLPSLKAQSSQSISIISFFQNTLSYR